MYDSGIQLNGKIRPRAGRSNRMMSHLRPARTHTMPSPRSLHRQTNIMVLNSQALPVRDHYFKSTLNTMTHLWIRYKAALIARQDVCKISDSRSDASLEGSLGGSLRSPAVPRRLGLH